MRDAAIDHARQSGRSGSNTRPSSAPSLDGTVDPRPPARGAKTGSVRVGGAVTSAAIAAQRLGGRRGRPSSPGALARLRGRLPRIRPFKTLAVAAFSIALVGIVANAMVFQRGHHPAPLFGTGQSADGAPDASQHTAATPPLPAPSPVERTGTISPPAVVALDPPPPAAAAPKTAPVHRAAAKPRQADGIGGLLDKAKDGTAKVHPRPGHAAPAAHPAGSEAKRAIPTAPSAHKASAATVAPDKPGVDGRGKGEAAPASHPHHRVAKANPASTAEAPGDKNTARTQ